MSQKVHLKRPRIRGYRPRQSERGQETCPGSQKRRERIPHRLRPFDATDSPAPDYFTDSVFACTRRPSTADNSCEVPHLKKKNPSSTPAPVADSTAAGLVVKVEF